MILDDVKTALRIKTDAFNSELESLIVAAKLDLGIAGIESTDDVDELIKRAIITFCKMSFGIPEDYDRLKRSYDEQKAQLQTATGYTDWGGLNV
jgi:hypothetical protein